MSTPFSQVIPLLTPSPLLIPSLNLSLIMVFFWGSALFVG